MLNLCLTVYLLVFPNLPKCSNPFNYMSYLALRPQLKSDPNWRPPKSFLTYINPWSFCKGVGGWGATTILFTASKINNGVCWERERTLLELKDETTTCTIRWRYQGSYSQDGVKFKDFSRTSKRLSYCFQGLNLMKNADLHVKILLWKCYSALQKLVLEK